MLKFRFLGAKTRKRKTMFKKNEKKKRKRKTRYTKIQPGFELNDCLNLEVN